MEVMPKIWDELRKSEKVRFDICDLMSSFLYEMCKLKWTQQRSFLSIVTLLHPLFPPFVS